MTNRSNEQQLSTRLAFESTTWTDDSTGKKIIGIEFPRVRVLGRMPGKPSIRIGKISARWISKLPSGRIDSSRSPWRDIVISMIPRNSTTVCRSPRVQRSPFLSIPLHLLRRCHCSGKTSRGTPIHQIPSFHRHRFSLAGDTTFRFSLFHSFDR